MSRPQCQFVVVEQRARHLWRAVVALMLAALLLLPGGASGQATQPARSDPAAALELRLSDRLADLRIEDGQVVVETPGGPRTMPAETFMRAIEARQRDGERRGWLFQLFDITGTLGLIWIAIGFGGQLLFTGRMLVQWLASERRKRSVVPPAFWWMSLVGASMLLAYFTWRRDIVGIFGQATGWVIYARNLWFIHRPKRSAAPPAAGAPPRQDPRSQSPRSSPRLPARPSAKPPAHSRA